MIRIRPLFPFLALVGCINLLLPSSPVWALREPAFSETRPKNQTGLEQVLGRQAGMEEERLEIAAHNHLLDSVREKFGSISNLTWIPVSTNSEKAEEQLKNFVAQDEIRRIVILDERYVPNEQQAAWILPEGHAPAVIVDGGSAGQLTPGYITQLLRFPEVSAGGIYFLRFKRDHLRLESQA